MIITLEDTSAGQINQHLHDLRPSGGAAGMIFTMIVPTPDGRLEQVRESALQAGLAHPSRIIVITLDPDAEVDRLDATLVSGSEIPGELVTARLSGQIARHPASALRPLILPDCPVTVWWPFDRPVYPADDPIGKLAGKRITDAASAPDPRTAIRQRARHLSAGDADLTWSRITHWRTLLAAALDQYPTTVTGACVEAEPTNAPALLMAAWLENRLNLPVRRVDTAGPGLTGVRLDTPSGEISLLRTDGLSAQYAIPGLEPRQVELTRRTLTELITEELQVLDADPVFEQIAATLVGDCGRER